MEENNVTKEKLISNVFWKFLERIAAQLVSLIISVILARLLMPEDYGIVALVIIFITIANCFVSEGIPASLIQKKDADNHDFSSVFYFNIVFSIVLYLILFFTAPFITGFFHTDGLTLVLRILGIQILISSVKSVLHAYVSKHLIFKKFFWATLIGTVISGVTGVIMAFNGCGVWSLVAQYLTNTLIDTIILWFVVKWRPIWYFSFKRIGKLFSFGWKLLLESLSNTIVGEIRSVIIGRVYSSSDLAYYNKGQQFPRLIVQNIGVSISSVMFPAVAAVQDDKEKVILLLRKSIRLTSFVIFPLLVGLGTVAKPFITILLTEKWLSVVPFLQIACFTNLLSIGMYSRHQALNGTGRSDVFMLEHVFTRIVGIVLLLLVYKISVLAIAMTGIVTGLLMTVTVFVTSRIFNGYRIKDQIVDILPPVIACALFGVPVYFLGMLPWNLYLVLALQVLTGAAIYLAFAALTRNEEFLFCIGFVKKLLKREKKEEAIDQ